MAIQLKELIIAVFLAIFLWYGITGSEKVESYIDVRLDYSGVPAGLVVTEGRVNKVTVRVRASEGLLRTASDRDRTLVIDLSSVVKGNNVVLVPVNEIKLSGGVEIMDVTPSRVQLTVDSLVEKTIPVVLHVAKKISPDYTVQVEVDPSEVLVKGGSELVDSIEETVLDVVLEDPLHEGVTTKKRVLAVTENVDIVPSSVNIIQRVEVKRKSVTVQIPVQTFEDETFTTEPSEVTVTCEAPLSLATPKKLAAVITASVTKNIFGGKTARGVVVEAPEAVKILSIEPEVVQIVKKTATQ